MSNVCFQLLLIFASTLASAVVGVRNRLAVAYNLIYHWVFLTIHFLCFLLLKRGFIERRYPRAVWERLIPTYTTHRWGWLLAMRAQGRFGCILWMRDTPA